jgi:hypothetical protein
MPTESFSVLACGSTLDRYVFRVIDSRAPRGEQWFSKTLNLLISNGHPHHGISVCVVTREAAKVENGTG